MELSHTVYVSVVGLHPLPAHQATPIALQYPFLRTLRQPWGAFRRRGGANADAGPCGPFRGTGEMGRSPVGCLGADDASSLARQHRRNGEKRAEGSLRLVLLANPCLAHGGLLAADG